MGVRSETLIHLRNQHRFYHCCLFVYAKYGLARNSELLELAFYDMNFNPFRRLSCYEAKPTLSGKVAMEPHLWFIQSDPNFLKERASKNACGSI